MFSKNKMPPYCFQYDEYNLALIKELCNFYINKILPDVNIHVEGKSIAAHKIILAASSPFFKSIFRTRKDTDLHFEDLSYESMKALIEYMYNGCLMIDYEFLTECLQLADSFKVRGISALYSDDVFTEPGPVSIQMQKTISELMSNSQKVLKSEGGVKLPEIFENLNISTQTSLSLPKLKLKRNASTGMWTKKIIGLSSTPTQNTKTSKMNTIRNAEKRAAPMQNTKENKFRRIETQLPKGNRNALNQSVKEKSKNNFVENRRTESPKGTNFLQSQTTKKEILDSSQKNGLKHNSYLNSRKNAMTNHRSTAETAPHISVPKKSYSNMTELKSAAIESMHTEEQRPALTHGQTLKSENFECPSNFPTAMQKSNSNVEANKTAQPKSQVNLASNLSEEHRPPNQENRKPAEASTPITQASHISGISISSSKTSLNQYVQSLQHISPMPKENGLKSTTNASLSKTLLNGTSIIYPIRRFKRQANPKALAAKHASRFPILQKASAGHGAQPFQRNASNPNVSAAHQNPPQNMKHQPNLEPTTAAHLERAMQSSNSGLEFSTYTPTSKPLQNGNSQFYQRPAQNVEPISTLFRDFKTAKDTSTLHHTSAATTKDDMSVQRSLLSPVVLTNPIPPSSNATEPKKELKKQKKPKKIIENLDLAQQYDILFGQDPQKDEKVIIRMMPTTSTATIPDTAGKNVAHNRVSDWHIDESDVFECDGDYEQHKNDPCPQPEELIEKERRVYGCPGCNKAYTLKSNYRRHYLINHKRLDIAVYKCPMCDSRFTRTDNRNQHIRKIHGFPDPVAVLSWDQPFHVCCMCKKGFVQEHELDRHTQMTHMNSYPKFL